MHGLNSTILYSLVTLCSGALAGLFGKVWRGLDSVFAGHQQAAIWNAVTTAYYHVEQTAGGHSHEDKRGLALDLARHLLPKSVPFWAIDVALEAFIGSVHEPGPDLGDLKVVVPQPALVAPSYSDTIVQKPS